MSVCSYCTTISRNRTMRLCRVSDIRTDNYIVVSGRNAAEFLAPYFIHEEWNALLSNLFVKALFAPYRACTALPDKKIRIPSTPLQSKIGLVERFTRCLHIGDALSSSPISNRDIISGCLPGNFRVAALLYLVTDIQVTPDKKMRVRQADGFSITLQ